MFIAALGSAFSNPRRGHWNDSQQSSTSSQFCPLPCPLPFFQPMKSIYQRRQLLIRRLSAKTFAAFVTYDVEKPTSFAHIDPRCFFASLITFIFHQSVDIKTKKYASPKLAIEIWHRFKNESSKMRGKNDYLADSYVQKLKVQQRMSLEK